MAAVTPYLEQAIDEDDATTESSALAAGDASEDEIVGLAHAGLLNLVYLRDAVYHDLVGRSFTAQVGNLAGGDTRKIYLTVEDGIGRGPAWNPNATKNIRQFQLLSWTSKMNTPSWSLPAGDPLIGGTCLGARAGQSVVPPDDRVHTTSLVNIRLGRPADQVIPLSTAICQRCYATGGQYSTGSVQYAQELRYMWAQQAKKQAYTREDGVETTVFVETMVYAVANANYKLAGNKTTPAEPIVDGVARKFFRVHDSGDFFDKEYFLQWMEVARRLPEITFWAPTRIWATDFGGGQESVVDAESVPPNFIIRPSAYAVDEAGPVMGPGWAAATTVLRLTGPSGNRGMMPQLEQYVAALEPGTTPRAGTDDRYDWDCRAYAADSTKRTCRNAVAPPGSVDGDQGCRACWRLPNLRINYTLH